MVTTAEKKTQTEAEAVTDTAAPTEAHTQVSEEYTRTKESYRTIGEKKFDQRAYFGWAGIGTFIATVLIAYLVRDSSVKIPFRKDGKTFKEGYSDLVTKGANWLKAKDVFKPGMMTNAEGKKVADPNNTVDDKAQKYSKMFWLTNATFIGGFLPLPIIRNMEHNKAKIVRRLNEKHGTAEDVAMGDANLRDEAPQDWISLIKGRLAAWAIVFVSFAGIGANLIPKTFGGLGKDMEDRAGEVGKRIHGWKGDTKTFFDASHDVDENLYPAEASDKQKKQMYRYKRFADLSAVDLFATAMSASLLYMLSKVFARKNQAKAAPTQKAETQPVAHQRTDQQTMRPEPALEQKQTNPEQEQATRYRDEVEPKGEVAPRDESYIAARKAERKHAEENQQLATAAGV